MAIETASIPGSSVLPAEQRREALARTIHNMVVSGYRVETQGEYQAVLVKGQRVNHLLHALLTLVTFGVWSTVWLILVLTGGESREIASVDEFGHVNREKV